jgi:hypothetical protein
LSVVTSFGTNTRGDGRREDRGEREQEAGTARRQEAGFRVQERRLPGSRKQEAGTGTPSRVIPPGARTYTRTHTTPYTTVIPAKAGIHISQTELGFPLSRG